jgi:hypothetical protein
VWRVDSAVPATAAAESSARTQVHHPLLVFGAGAAVGLLGGVIGLD